MEKNAFLFPGQGSQYAGMGKNFYDSHPEVRTLFDEASDAVGVNMGDLCFNGPDEKLKETENAQTAISLVNASCLTVLRKTGFEPHAAAGHSLGEYSALYASGAIGFTTMMRLVRDRARFMTEAAKKNPGTMVAVMGMDSSRVIEACREVMETAAVEAANFNSPLQTILTGEETGIKRAVELLKAAGARLIIPLKVSGPWHSRSMKDAAERMAQVLDTVEIKMPAIPVALNVTAGYAAAPEEIRTNLVRQISSPVLWAASMTRLINDGCTLFIEAGPNKVLKGLMREIDRSARTFNVENTETLNKLVEACREYNA